MGESSARLAAITERPFKMPNPGTRGKNFNLYLGTQEKREERIEKLNALATQFGLTSIGQLVAAIADGELELHPPALPAAPKPAKRAYKHRTPPD